VQAYGQTLLKNGQNTIKLSKIIEKIINIKLHLTFYTDEIPQEIAETCDPHGRDNSPERKLISLRNQAYTGDS
jgi:hypothetical protein